MINLKAQNSFHEKAKKQQNASIDKIKVSEIKIGDNLAESFQEIKSTIHRPMTAKARPTSKSSDVGTFNSPTASSKNDCGNLASNIAYQTPQKSKTEAGKRPMTAKSSSNSLASTTAQKSTRPTTGHIRHGGNSASSRPSSGSFISTIISPRITSAGSLYGLDA